MAWGRLLGPILLTAFLALASASPSQEPAEAKQKSPEAETELQRAVEEAGNDRAALVRNLEDYLRRFPDAPRKTAIYRALVEASMQLQDRDRALDYAERIIAVQADDSSMLLFAVDLLEQRADQHSLTKAVGYITRVVDRAEKEPPGDKPARMSAEDWELNRKKLLMSVYLMRGRLQVARRQYDQAQADLETSYRTLTTPAAAMHLGEIAEIRKDYARAIEHYSTAFVLPDHYGTGVDRRDVRRKLGNLWRLVHGGDAGLGENLLAAYDRAMAESEALPEVTRNAAAQDVYAFVLRRLNGSELKLDELKGKIVVMNFWATWCGPCRALEPLFEQVMRDFEDRNDVVFLAVNTDEDEARVAPYVQREKVRAPVVFADGLNRFLGIEAIPTVLILDRSGRIHYRAEGFAFQSFVADLTAALRSAL